MSQENEVPSEDVKDFCNLKSKLRASLSNDLGNYQCANISIGIILEKITKRVQEELSAQRAEWEKEKYDLLTYGANQAETIGRLEAELADHKKNHNTAKWNEILSKRMDQITALESEKKALEDRVRELEDEISHFKDDCGLCHPAEHEEEILRLKSELEKVRGENEELRKTESSVLSLSHPNFKEYQNRIDTLTCALAEALECAKVIAFPDAWKLDCETIVVYVLNVRAKTAKKITDNPVGLRVSEEMKALRITKSEYDEAMKFCVENFSDHRFGSVKDCISSVMEEMKALRKVVEVAKELGGDIFLVDQGLVVPAKFVNNLTSALEAYEAQTKKGGV